MLKETQSFPEYASNPSGGDVLTTNLNMHYDKGDLAWILCASLACWLITPVRICGVLIYIGYWTIIRRNVAAEICFCDAPTVAFLRGRCRFAILDVRFFNDNVSFQFFNYWES